MASQPIGHAAWRGRNRRPDWLVLILAIWLFISPWALRFGVGLATAANGAVTGPAVETSRAAWDAWILGFILFLVGLSAVGRISVQQKWIVLILAAWVFVAPWALGFTSLRRASWDHWIVGALVFLVALWTLSGTRVTPVVAEPPLDGRPPVGPPGNRVP
jgi:hypothetical protein